MDKLISHQITAVETAEVQELSPRQALRLKAKVIEPGLVALAHGNRGRSPALTLSDSVRQTVMQAYTYTERYLGSNHCHISDLLAEYEQIHIRSSTVDRILTAAGMAPVRQRRRSKPHRPRDHKSPTGMLWQNDASTHA